jgi:hypothetical protein
MRLTRFSRFLITVLIVLGILLGVRYALLHTDQGKVIMEKAEKAAEENNIEDPIFK